ncbi:MAG: tetratricopeptide repeat protein [Saprospiraceae bacterium]|nr:tetratricopeptide repeat protein [Saprospiraceae bacterium]
MKNFWKYPALLLVLTAIVFGCVTQKSKNAEPSGFKRRYHNLTSHYNYWFNADELFRLTTQKSELTYKDNYNKILELYPAVASDSKGAGSDYENVIKKASKGIALHRVSGWTDDCYLLIGQSQYMKRDFETAEATFKYMKDEQDPRKKVPKAKKSKKKKASAKKDTKKKTSSKKKKKSSKKKKKSSKSKSDKAKADEKAKADQKAADNKEADKKEAAKPEEEYVRPAGENPYKKGWSRTAAYPEAMVWYGRTLIEREKFDEAEFLFRDLEADGWFPLKLRDDLFTAFAHLYIRQGQYEKAIPALEKAIKYTDKKKQRARLAYVLAQLSERAGQMDKAYAAFETVLNSRPRYEMEFNARLHQIEAGWANGKINAESATNSCEKLLKDGKNLEYRDQIYFVMARIALKEGAKKDGIAYLRKSLDFNTGNAAQRAESYLMLANLYFDDEDFVQAKNYFDSTLTVLPNTDERYKRVNDYAVNLKDIARLIQTITANDSIIRVYGMSDAERKDLAKTIKKRRAEEARAEADRKAKELAEKAKNPNAGKAPPPVAGAKASTFYFYNENFLKKGKKDFSRTWGTRKLEDNWRRSNRPNTGGNDELAAADSTRAINDDADLNDIFSGIPKSEAELSVIHASTYEAMYQLGTLFRDKIQNNQRCVGTLEELQRRYPDTLKYEKETWYYCYLAHTELTNADRAKYYYDKLVGKYPTSSFARAISDPNFLSATDARRREINNYYEDTYKAFNKGAYKDAFDRCADAPKRFGSQHPIMPKFALLSALCVGNLQGNDAYCTALKEVIGRYPESVEATRAKEIARLLNCKGFEVDDTKKAPDANADGVDASFTLEDDKLHYLLVVIQGDVAIEPIKSSISDYNNEKHKSEGIRMSNIFLGSDSETPILVLRKFDNRETAMRYLKEIKTAKDFLGESDKKTYTKEYFVITQENYRKVLKNKTLSGYREFFNENYQK